MLPREYGTDNLLHPRVRPPCEVSPMSYAGHRAHARRVDAANQLRVLYQMKFRVYPVIIGSFPWIHRATASSSSRCDVWLVGSHPARMRNRRQFACSKHLATWAAALARNEAA